MSPTQEEVIKILESTPSTKKRKSVCGVGINDAPFSTSKRLGGKLYHHPAYKDWHNMINRCYSGRYRSYSGATVSGDWHSFMGFYCWWKNHNIPGYSLDKDLVVEGNKVYSEKTCIYIPVWLNSYISNTLEHTRGVTFDRTLGKYKAQRSGANRYIGYFDTEEEAHLAWKSENRNCEDIESLDIYLRELVLKRTNFRRYADI